MNHFSLYELKQILQMRNKITLFESKKIDLKDLVDDLLGLCEAIETEKLTQKDELEACISDLELILLSFTDGSISRWKGNPTSYIYEKLLKIKTITFSIIETYLRDQSENSFNKAIFDDQNVELTCPICLFSWQFLNQDVLTLCPKCEKILINTVKS